MVQRILAGLLAKITGIKAIMHEHVVDPAYPFYQTPFDFFLAGMTDSGIAVSNSVKEFMADKRHIPREKTETIFNGVPLREFKLPAESEILAEKKKLHIADGQKVVATIGRIDTQKGNSYFLEAASTIMQNGHNVKFLLVGDGPLMEQLKEQCRQLYLEEHVVFTGYHANIPLVQSLIDIQVFPSLWEEPTYAF